MLFRSDFMNVLLVVAVVRVVPMLIALFALLLGPSQFGDSEVTGTIPRPDLSLHYCCGFITRRKSSFWGRSSPVNTRFGSAAASTTFLQRARPPKYFALGAFEAFRTALNKWKQPLCGGRKRANRFNAPSADCPRLVRAGATPCAGRFRAGDSSRQSNRPPQSPG